MEVYLKMINLTKEQINQIPSGIYCYSPENGDICPFWFKNKFNCGDCHLFDDSEFYNGEEDGCFDACLHDQCKSCGINWPSEEEMLAEWEGTIGDNF